MARTPQGGGPSDHGAARHLLGQPGFPDARLASQHEQAAPALERPIQSRIQDCHLQLAADEGSLAAAPMPGIGPCGGPHVLPLHSAQTPFHTALVGTQHVGYRADTNTGRTES